MDDLIRSYKGSLRSISRLHRRYGKEMDRLKVKSVTNQEKAEQWIERFKANRSLLSGMMRDLEFGIEWMETARMPGNRRGIERRGYKQREMVFDPVLIRKVVQAKQGYSELPERDLQLLDDLLGCLNREQYECFVMIRGSGYTFSEVASMMGITKSVVHYHLHNAEKKLREKASNLQEGLQGVFL